MSPRRVGSTSQGAPAWPTAAASRYRNFQVFSPLPFDSPHEKENPPRPATRSGILFLSPLTAGPQQPALKPVADTWARDSVSPTCKRAIRPGGSRGVGVEGPMCAGRCSSSLAGACEWKGSHINAPHPPQRPALSPPKSNSDLAIDGGGVAAVAAPRRFQKLPERPRRSGEGPKQAEPNRDASRCATSPPLFSNRIRSDFWYRSPFPRRRRRPLQ